MGNFLPWVHQEDSAFPGSFLKEMGIALFTLWASCIIQYVQLGEQGRKSTDLIEPTHSHLVPVSQEDYPNPPLCGLEALTDKKDTSCESLVRPHWCTS